MHETYVAMREMLALSEGGNRMVEKHIQEIQQAFASLPAPGIGIDELSTRVSQLANGRTWALNAYRHPDGRWWVNVEIDGVPTVCTYLVPESELRSALYKAWCELTALNAQAAQ